MPSITLIIADLGPGGAQRVLSWLANRWARSGRTVELLTFDDGAASPHHELDPRVRRRPLAIARPSRGTTDAVRANLGRLRALRAALDDGSRAPVLSFVDTTNVLAAVAGAAAGRPVVVSERIDPHEHTVGRAWSRARAAAYALVDRIVVQTARARSYFAPRLASRIEIIPNPVDMPPTGDAFRGGGGWVAMGRLDHQKGFDLLIEAFARSGIAENGGRLTIWGEGPARPQLESLRDRLGLTTAVDLPGVTREPARALGRADAFVLSSRYEGFPNVLCEALALGVACVAFDCPAGPAEILGPGRAGLLLPSEDVDALASAMRRLSQEPDLRARLGARGASAVQRYSPDVIGRTWDRLLHDVTAAWDGSRSLASTLRSDYVEPPAELGRSRAEHRGRVGSETP